MLKKLMNFYKDEEGATLIEYALLVALIAIAVIAAIATLSGGISTIFTKVGTKLSTEGNKVN